MIADFHNDILTSDQKDKLNELSLNTDLCVCAAFCGDRTFTEVRKIVEKFRCERAQNQILSLEDASYLSDENIDEICAWNPVAVSLTWNGENALAGGCLCDACLKPLGKKMVKELALKGVAVDCAHLNEQSFRSVLDYTGRVVDTHTCLSGVYNHPRNLKDWQIGEIAERGGLIGITLVGRFTGTEKANAFSVFRHFDYGVQKFGDELFCFGTDFNGTSDLPDGLKDYCQMDEFIELFLKAGYSSASINKLFRENLMRFLANKD